MSDGAERAKKSIALVGLPGAGKTTVGRALAERLALPFADSDPAVEAAAGHPVAEIFARFGEAHFRELERSTIARLLDGPAQVIATGGGAFMNPATRTVLRERCITIWLDGDAGLLAARAARRGGRPLLADADPVGVLRALAEIRNPIYAEADLRIGCQRRHAVVVEKILAALRASRPPR